MILSIKINSFVVHLCLNTSLAVPGALAQCLQRRQLLLNKFFDPSTPCMRKVEKRGEQTLFSVVVFIKPGHLDLLDKIIID